MRRVFMAAIAAVVGFTTAPAWADAGSTLADFQYTREVLAKRIQDFGSPNSPFSQLSKKTRAWIVEETKRQAADPRPVADVVVSVDAALAEDAADIARKHRIDPLDITRVVTLAIMADAEDHAAKGVKKARKSSDEAARAAAEQNLAQATANRQEAFAMQSQVSLALAAM